MLGIEPSLTPQPPFPHTPTQRCRDNKEIHNNNKVSSKLETNKSPEGGKGEKAKEYEKENREERKGRRKEREAEARRKIRRK